MSNETILQFPIFDIDYGSCLRNVVNLYLQMCGMGRVKILRSRIFAQGSLFPTHCTVINEIEVLIVFKAPI